MIYNTFILKSLALQVFCIRHLDCYVNANTKENFAHLELENCLIVKIEVHAEFNVDNSSVSSAASSGSIGFSENGNC